MKTLYKYIQVQEGFVLTSDEEIKVGDWYIVKLYKITEYEDNGGTFTLEQCKKTEDVWINNFDVVQTRYKDNCKKIIFCSPNLSLDGVPVIEIGEDIKKLAKEHQQGGYEWQEEKRKSFIAGFNHPKRGRYSEEDMNKVRLWCAGDFMPECKILDELLKFLNPIPVSVEVEADDDYWDYPNQRPKLIKRPDGRMQGIVTKINY